MPVPHRRDGRSPIKTVAAMALVAVTSLSAFAAASANAAVDFDHGTRYSVPGIADPGPLAVADFTGDGFKDILVGGQSSMSVLVHKPNGLYFPIGYTGLNAVRDVVTGDFNHDDIPDAAVLDSTGTVTVYAGQHSDDAPLASVPIATQATGYFSLAPDTQHLAAGDVDGDGADDLVVSGYDQDSFKLLTNSGDGTAFTVSTVADVSDSHPEGIALGDLDGDGKLDVVTANAGNTQRTVSVYLNQGGSTPFSAHAEYPNGLNAPGLRIAVRDVVGDDSPDVIMSSFNAGFAYLEGDGSGALADGVGASNAATNQGFAISDFDHDGTTDFVTWDRSGGNPKYLYFRSLERDGTWPTPGFLNASEAPAAINGGSTFYEDFPVAADMDNDGYDDVVMADGNDHSVAIMGQDRTAPATAIGDGPTGTISDTSVTFKFGVDPSAEPFPVTYECRLTGPGQDGEWATCGQTPQPPDLHREATYTGLADGDYTFDVRATDYVGNVESPVTRTFTVDTHPATDPGDGGAGDAPQGGGDTGVPQGSTGDAKGTPPGGGDAKPGPAAPKPGVTHSRLTLAGLHAALAVAPNGTVVVPVGGAAGAKGRLLIRTVGKFRIKNGARSRHDRKHRIARITLAKRDFVVSADGTLSLKVKLVNQYRAALKGVKRVKATIKVTTAGGVTTTKTVTLKLPAAKGAARHR